MSALALTHPKLLMMTDYDGTLVPIREQPRFALPSSGLVKVLKRLVKKPGVTLAVVSGRDTDELKRLLPVDGIYLAGCHGAEVLYPSGEKFKSIKVEKLSPALNMIADKACSIIDSKEGFLVERKKAAVALHYRLAEPATALQVLGSFVTAIRPLVTGRDLEFVAGKKVIEIRPKGVHKGKAIRHLMKLCPGFYPVYIGDDTTDEDGFKVVQEKGLGVLVAGHKKFTAATHWLRGPQDVLRFLQIISARC